MPNDYQAVSARKIIEKFNKGKAIVIIGPRQVGKSTLMHEIFAKMDNVLAVNGDDFAVQQRFSLPDKEQITRIVRNYSIVFIDEAQRIPQIGLTSKIIIDQFPHIQLILTGSSALDLNNQINEPLTGRKWEFNLFPISMAEMEQKFGWLEADSQLENRIIFGMYPDVLNYKGDEEEVLTSLVNSYLFKDILALSGIKKPDMLQKLTQALALQIGNEVSYNELAQLLGINKETVSNYIDLLEKAFVVFKVNAFSRNMRNEIKNNRKIYFYNTGLRNALISNFNPLNLRNDKGALWENFLISERIKMLKYQKKFRNTYFWRTAQQQEIDWIEEKDGVINAFEFKWKASNRVRFPKGFVETYMAKTNIIHRGNYSEFVLDELPSIGLLGLAD